MSSIPQSTFPRVARWLPAVLVLAAAGFVAVRVLLPQQEKTAAKGGEHPQTRISRLIAAETNGDADLYLHCFGGALREKVRAQIDAGPQEKFALELRNRMAGFSGHALSDFRQPDSETTLLTLERIFNDRHTVQQIELKRLAGQWQIVALGEPRTVPADQPSSPDQPTAAVSQ